MIDGTCNVAVYHAIMLVPLSNQHGKYTSEKEHRPLKNCFSPSSSSSSSSCVSLAVISIARRVRSFK